MQAEIEKCYKYSNQILTWAGKSCATSQRNDSILALTLSSPWALQSLGGLSGLFAESCHWGQTKVMPSPAPLERQVWAPVHAGELQNNEQLLFFFFECIFPPLPRWSRTQDEYSISFGQPKIDPSLPLLLCLFFENFLQPNKDRFFFHDISSNLPSLCWAAVWRKQVTHRNAGQSLFYWKDLLPP